MSKKKGSLDREKELLREILEEEEIIVRKSKKKKRKKSKKKENILQGLLGEASKEFSTEDEEAVKKLLTRMPIVKKKEREIQEMDEDFLRIGRSGDASHKRDLESAFNRYHKVHFMRMLKVAIVLLIIFAVIFFLAKQDEWISIEKEKPERFKIERYNETVINTNNHDIDYSSYYSGAVEDELTTILGFLTYTLTSEPSGVTRHTYYAEDDHGNLIQLAEITGAQKRLFVKNGTTEKIYNITGSFGWSLHRMEFRVRSMREIERPASKTKRVIERERRIPVTSDVTVLNVLDYRFVITK